MKGKFTDTLSENIRKDKKAMAKRRAMNKRRANLLRRNRCGVGSNLLRCNRCGVGFSAALGGNSCPARDCGGIGESE